MDFTLSKQQQMVQKMYREFAENEVKPLAKKVDAEEYFPKETVEKMGKLGMMGIYFPTEVGGAGGDVLSYVMAVEELSKVCGTTGVTQKLDEVVVTALGMKRDKKALGYAMQELKGDELLSSREPNLANSLSGKVSGLQIVRSSNGVGGSSKIVLRGNSSLTGSNQPLIVVDGTPMDNFTGGVDDVWGNSGADMGNGLSDINPEDIESMTVLKGASAAALYGSRAGNGVILITTKSGRKNEGLGITVNAGITAESIFLKPDMQNSCACK